MAGNVAWLGIDGGQGTAYDRGRAPREMKESGKFWNTLPGVLTAIAGVITAVAGLLQIPQVRDRVWPTTTIDSTPTRPDDPTREPRPFPNNHKKSEAAKEPSSNTAHSAASTQIVVLYTKAEDLARSWVEAFRRRDVDALVRLSELPFFAQRN